MKKILFLILLLAIISSLFGQYATFNRPDGQLIKTIYLKPLPPSKMVLYDLVSNYKYCIDSLRIHIKAINEKGQTVWVKDPWKDNNLGNYRTIRPLILDWGFRRFSEEDARIWNLKPNQLIIWIQYHNSQTGFITLDDGRFYFTGQD